MPIYIRASVGYRFAVMFQYPIDILKRRRTVIFNISYTNFGTPVFKIFHLVIRPDW